MKENIIVCSRAVPYFVCLDFTRKQINFVDSPY